MKNSQRNTSTMTNLKMTEKDGKKICWIIRNIYDNQKETFVVYSSVDLVKV